MRFTRRGVLRQGGGVVAALTLGPALKSAMAAATAQEVVDISMAGRRDGSRVWFDPVGVRVRAGQTVRWTNEDAANSHTATAYHPDTSDRPHRVPQGAEPWDSGYLMPGEAFSVTLTVPGVYDYYCIPHEMAGMVGRIVVDAPPQGWVEPANTGDGLPGAALRSFPSVEEIMMKGLVRRE